MGKHDRFNRTVPRGWRWRYEWNSRATERIKVKCYRYDGTGVDRFGAHCTECENNREKWEAYGASSLSTTGRATVFVHTVKCEPSGSIENAEISRRRLYMASHAIDLIIDAIRWVVTGSSGSSNWCAPALRAVSNAYALPEPPISLPRQPPWVSPDGLQCSRP